MKKIIVLILALLLLSSLAVFANDATLPRLVDNADVLSASEEEALLSLLDKISENRECDVVIITLESLNGQSETAVADGIYDEYGFGYGPGDDGILFLISMDERRYATSTFGFGIEAFTDYGQDTILEEALPYISEGEYFKGFSIFATRCDEYIEKARLGEAYSETNPKFQFEFSWVVIALVVGLVAALIYTLVLKSQLKSVSKDNYAESYVVQGSLNLTTSNDTFLYRNVTRTPRPQDTDSSSGSSLRTSSSGRSHGGRSGSF